MHRVVQLDEHNIGVSNSVLGVETVSYDGIVKSKAFSIMGGTHVFTMREGDTTAEYEVRLRWTWTGMSCQISVKRNGVEAFSEAVSTKAATITGLFCGTFAMLVVLATTGVLRKAIYSANAPTLTNEQMIAVRNTAKRNSVMIFATHKNSAAKGSGFVVRRLGDKAIVATNGHVVLDEKKAPTTIFVRPPGQSSLMKADLLFAEESEELRRDLALLVVHDPLNQLGQEVQLARSVKKGEFVLSVGNPLDEDFTVDDGVVEHVEVSSELGNTIFHDALIEHGSSGGGLFNSKGELLGINTYILSDGKTGVALSNSIFLNKLKLYSLKVSANAGWQNSGIQVNASNHRVVVLAQGTWGISGFLSAVDALGTDGYKEYSLFPSLRHGSLLMSLDGGKSAVAIDRWWQGAVREDSAYLSYAVENQNRNLSFRINDTDVRNNTGHIDVTILVW